MNKSAKGFGANLIISSNPRLFSLNGKFSDATSHSPKCS